MKTEPGELLLDGGKWRLYRNGVMSRQNYISWQNVEEIYVSGSVRSVEHIPAGEKRTIKLVDSHKNSVRITLSGFFRMSEAQKEEFVDVYSFILHEVGNRQWRQFQQRLRDGQRISFKALDIAQDGIYCVKGSKKIFGRALGYDRIEMPSITGYDIRDGIFYIHFINNKGKRSEKYIDYIEDIPNIHIVQTLIQEISEYKSQLSLDRKGRQQA